jgi:hypothetical protein
MSPGRPRRDPQAKTSRRPGYPARELDELITEITVDAYGEDEALTGFEVAFDDLASFPVAGTVVGEEVEVLSVAVAHGRRELVASCSRGGRRYDVALLDVECSGDSDFERILAAYRRWLGCE